MRQIMAVEVSVDRELAAGLDLMQSAAVPVRIGDQSGNTGHLFEELQEGPAIEEVQEQSYWRRDRFLLVEGNLDLTVVREAVPECRAGIGKCRQQCIQQRVIEQIVDDDVGKWLGGPISRTMRVGQGREPIGLNQW